MINTTSVELLGLGAPTEAECAQRVKPMFYAAAGANVGVIGLGLFSTYKFFKGRPAAGATGLVAGGLLFLLGHAMLKASTDQFKACVPPGTLPLTAAQAKLKATGAASMTCAALYPGSDTQGLWLCLRDHPGGTVTL